MPGAAHAIPSATPPVRPALRTVLAALCLTEIVSWGVLYYAFPVLAPGIAADTGWSLTAISAAFSAGLVTSAVVGIPVGRLLDGSGPRAVMTAGSVLAGLAVGLIAWSPNLAVFALAWAVAGVAMAGVLYQPAFAALTRWYGARHLPALATLTLVAGLASTVFAPLTAGLDARLDWRGVYLVLGIGLLVVTVPAHAIGLRRPWPPDSHGHDDESADVGEYAASVTTTARFRLLVIGLTAASLAMYAALINLVPLLLEQGISAGVAAWALGLGGVGQVAGRIVYTLSAHRVSLRSRTGLVFTLSAASIAALAVAPGHALILIGLSMVAGVARGIATLLHATAVTDRWGPRAYGRLSGILGAPVVFASALAPWVGAALAELTGSYATTYGLLSLIAATGALLMTLSTPSRAVA
ncbi:MFS transporter [Nocardioides sp. J54]|uniref:MFS transporter n=1 Tax=Nocardioides sp. J54 TaxID=935866 RepID=UPI000686ABBB|nr:MFS transporter [Nocardioides sp. J54]